MLINHRPQWYANILQGSPLHSNSHLDLHLELSQKISQLADQCVKCGMCLPGCPTYQVNKNENESPRGRIALMQGLVQGELALSSKVKNHLDHCVSCLSCEKICPSTVQYETLIDGIREYTAIKQQSKVSANLISFLTSAAIHKSIFPILRFYQLSGIQALVRKLGVLKLIGLHTQEKLLPKLSPRLNLKPHYLTKQNALGTVALFTGCMGNLFEQKAIQASIQVLNTLGYNVDIPSQVCCGALHQHSGFRSHAETLATKNRQSFLSNKNYAAVLFTASGCGAQLKSVLKKSPAPVTSVMQFIHQHAQFHSLELNTIKHQNTELHSVAIHQPCSLKNTLGEDDAVLQLLAKIPMLTLTELSAQCCGAAGKNMLTQTKLANQIRQPLLEQIHQVSANVVVSSNIGCALHLMAGMGNDSINIKNTPLLHPIELIAKALDKSST